MAHTIAIGMFCKTPAAGSSKTRLSPPLTPEECAALSACFIRDVAATIDEVVPDGVTGYAVYTPAGTEPELRKLLPASFRLLLQTEEDFGARVTTAMRQLLETHAGAILVNADSPTLPVSILRAAIEAIRLRDVVALSPALDGGYTLIGLSQLHARLFADIPWSTAQVHRRTIERANEIGVPVVDLPGWYDVDDAASLEMLLAELTGTRPPFAEPALIGASAPATRRYWAARQRIETADLHSC